MPETLPILIAGAGPTGLTAAMELQRMGVPVRLVDEAKGPSETSRALGVQARTLELFAQRGLADEMLRLGNPARHVAVYGSGRLLGRVDLTRVPSRYNYVFMLSEAETERILRARLASGGVSPEYSTTLIAFSQTEHGCVGVLRKPDGSLEEAKAAYLIGAEGAHSVVRRTLGIEFKGKSLENSYMLGDVEIDGEVSNEELTVFPAAADLLAIFPMGERRFRIIGSERTEGTTDAPAPTLEELQRLYDTASHIPGRLHDMHWSSRFRINSRMVDRLRVGRIFIGGDAAHIHSPVGGQGMNTGIQDMINLSWKLAAVYHGHAIAELLDTYGPERLPVIEGVVSGTETATDSIQSASPWARQAILYLFPIALSAGAVQEHATAAISQTTYLYDQTGLAGDVVRGGEIKAGARVPDTDLPEGSSLQHRLNPSRCTVLVPEGVDRASLDASLAAWISSVVELQSIPAESFEKLFGDDAGAALVRPDGHLAVTVRTEVAGPQLRRWLERWFPVEKAA